MKNKPVSRGSWVPLVLGLACAGLWPSVAQAQEELPTPRQVVSLSVLPLVDPILPGISASWLRPMPDGRHYLRWEAGAILNFNTQPPEQLLSLWGFRTRVAWRTITRSRILAHSDHFSYWEIGLGYHYFAAERAAFFEREGGAFSQRLIYNIQRQALTVSMFRGDMGVIRNSWQIDLAVGFGVRIHHHRHRPNGHDAIPDDAQYTDTPFSYFIWDYERQDEGQWLMVPYVGVTMAVGRRL